MNSGIEFFKNKITDNNYDGFELIKQIDPSPEDDVFHNKKRNKINARKPGISDFLKELYSFLSTQNINNYINQITFDEEFDAHIVRLSAEAGCTEIDVGGVNSLRGAFEWQNIVVPISGRIKGYCWAKRDTIGQAGSLQNLRYDFETNRPKVPCSSIRAFRFDIFK